MRRTPPWPPRATALLTLRTSPRRRPCSTPPRFLPMPCTRESRDDPCRSPCRSESLHDHGAGHARMERAVVRVPTGGGELVRERLVVVEAGRRGEPRRPHGGRPLVLLDPPDGGAHRPPERRRAARVGPD